MYLFKYTFLCVLLTLTAIEAVYSQCAKFEPPNGKALMIIGQDMDATGGIAGRNEAGYVEQVGLVPAGVTTYVGLDQVPGYGVTTIADWGAGPICADCYADNGAYDESVVAIGLYMVGDLINTLRGRRDDHLRALGNWIKSQAPRPIFLRVGYEFELQYWREDPDDYRDAFRYVVDFMNDELQIDNVAYVWQAASGTGSKNYLLQWYPGDEYVDWLAYSHFGGNNTGNTMISIANDLGKPIMIAEAMAKGERLDEVNGAFIWNDYFEPLFEKIYDHNIKALAYINQDWDKQDMWSNGAWGNSRVQDNSYVKNKWLNELAKDYWLNAIDEPASLLVENAHCNLKVELEDELIYLPEELVIINSEVVGGIEPYSYSWEQLSGLNLSLSGVEMPGLEVNDPQSGTYEFELTVADSQGLMAKDTMTLVAELATALSLENNKKTWLLYPTNVKDVLYIRHEGKEPEAILNTYNSSKGHIVATQELQEGKAQLNVSHLAPGLYVLQIVTSEGVSVHRFVKQ